MKQTEVLHWVTFLTVLKQVQTITSEFKPFQMDCLFLKHAYLASGLLFARRYICCTWSCITTLNNFRHAVVTLSPSSSPCPCSSSPWPGSSRPSGCRSGSMPAMEDLTNGWTTHPLPTSLSLMKRGRVTSPTTRTSGSTRYALLARLFQPANIKTTLQ